MNKLINLSLILVITIISLSCDNGKTQTEKDDEIIQEYIKENNLDMTKSSYGIYYKIDKAGYGGYPSSNSTVKVSYKGYLLDGTVFDQSTGTVEFNLSYVIDGWQIAISMLQKAGSGTFIIPSGLAYGKEGKGSIPPNTVLIFDISLVDFN